MSHKKVVLITGASSGIGRACAYFLAAKGFIVYAGSRTPDKIDKYYPNLYPIKLDLTDFAEVQQSIDTIYTQEGALDVVINNAGYGLIAAVEDITEEEMQNQFDINLFSIFRVCKAAIPYLKRQDDSVIINMSSYFGKVAFPLMSCYSASKFAVEGLTDALRYELKDLPIRVHSLRPGFTRTNFTQTDLVKNSDTLYENRNYQDGSKHLTSQLLENINNGVDPIMIAEAAFEIINNPQSNTSMYVGSKDNKILSMRETLGDDDFDKRIIGHKELSWNSLFYSASQNRYTITELIKSDGENIKKVDISNGIVSFDINLKDHAGKRLETINVDKMVTIVVVKEGEVHITDHTSDEMFILERDHVYLFASSKQHFSIELKPAKKSQIFVLAIADFILKRYLSPNENEPINYLYHKTAMPYLTLVNRQPLDALTVYLLQRIEESDNRTHLHAITGEHRVIELMLYQFSLLDICEKEIDSDSLEIATTAGKILLKEFIAPPTLAYLAHQCATNKTKLQKAFKAVHHMTVAEYVKKLRLEKANLLLREQSMSIGEIAKAVGYQHQGNFSKLFFKEYGVYPKALLKQNC